MDSDVHDDIGILLLPPEVYAGVGRVLVIIWFISTVLSILATAIFFLGNNVNSVIDNFSSLIYDYRTYFALGFGVFIQSILLAAQIAVSYVHAMLARQYGESAVINKRTLRSAKARKILWCTLSNSILLFNYIADVIVLQSLGVWQSTAFCLTLFACNFFLGVFGAQIIWAANKSKQKR